MISFSPLAPLFVVWVTDVGCLAVLTCRLHLSAEVGATVTIGFVVADLQSARTVFHDSDFKGVELQDHGGESQFVNKLLSRVRKRAHRDSNMIKQK